GITTINNATVSVMNNDGTGPNNVLPSTTVLNLVNNGWFVLDNGATAQTIAGLTGDATGRAATSNNVNAVGLTIDPAAGQSYTFAGVVGPQTILGKTGAAAVFSLT